MYRADGDQAGELRGLLSCDYTVTKSSPVGFSFRFGFLLCKRQKVGFPPFLSAPETSFASRFDSIKGGRGAT